MSVIIIHANEDREAELLPNDSSKHKVHYVSDIDDFLKFEADVFIDLLFINESLRVEALKKLSGIVIINSVTDTLGDLQLPFTRINAWPGFMNNIIEGSCKNESLKRLTEIIFQSFDKKIEWLPDEPGFVTPRIISMIINEAYFALDEGISTKEEIDLAMRLGTAYPYGPFEWGLKIGLDNICNLLTRLGEKEPSYSPALSLVREAAQTEL